jgi:integrase
MAEEVAKHPYLYREKDRGWTFRRRVPKALQGIIGQTELSEALNAATYAEAKRLCDLRAAASTVQFENARRKLANTSPAEPDHQPSAEPAAAPPGIVPRSRLPEPPADAPEPTEAEVRSLVMLWFQDEERRAEAEWRRVRGTGEEQRVADSLHADLAALSAPRSATRGEPEAVQDVEDRVQRAASAIFTRHGFALPGGTLRELASGLIETAMLENVRRSLDRYTGVLSPRGHHPDFAGVTALTTLPPVAPRAGLQQPSQPPLKAEELLTKWARENEPSPATARKYAITFRHLAAILGFDDVRRITRDDGVRFKEARLADGRKPGTVQDDILAAGAVCNWAANNGLLTSNPFARLAPRVRRRGPPSRTPYTDEEAVRILTAARSEKGFLRWAPWLLAFSGARVSEIADMKRRHVRVECGVWILDFVPLKERAGKNEHFQRMVPIHPAVIAEGFLKYVEALPADPNGPLFPDLLENEIRGRASDASLKMRRWIRKTLGIEALDKGPNHSWRHRMEDELRRVRPLPEVQDAITGRYNPRNSGVGYGDGFRRMPDETLKDLRRIPSPFDKVAKKAGSEE